MNKERKRELLDVTDILDDAVTSIQDVIDEEQESFDNLPPGLQDSKRGTKMEDAIVFMEGLVSDIEAVEQKIKNYE